MDEDQIETLMSFLGYGRLSAPVWFIGMEEAGGTREQLFIRTNFEPVMDLWAAHNALGIHHHHQGPQKLQPTWNKMCDYMLTRNQLPNNREARRAYQANLLGRSIGDTFLAELMPIPVPSVGEWPPYLVESLRVTRLQYMEQRLLARQQLLAQAIAEQEDVRLVLAYGIGDLNDPWLNYRSHFMGIFPNRQFIAIGNFLVSQGEPLIVLTHHLTTIQMNDGAAALHALVDRYR